jgi:hypothetical protein
MDMLNELKRCPKELFPLLSETDKQKFIPKDFNEDEYDEDGYEPIPELKRHRNRFYYFAMRCLENSFDHLKFHIDLGNYCFKSYDQIIEEVPRKRRWIKRVMAFGNLVDFEENKRPQEWEDKLDKLTELEKPDTYITETTPHYHFDGEGDVKNIGLKWIDDYDKSQIWPSVSEIDKDGALAKPRNESPDYWLSLYELPALAFYQVLFETSSGRVKISAEQVIADYKTKIHGFLNDVLEGKIESGFSKEDLENELSNRSLHIKNIPKAVIKYLLSKSSESLEEKGNKRLLEFMAENDMMLSRVERQTKHHNRKPGSKDYIPLKSGNMADFLARDLIRLQKPLNQDQGKANSTEFQVLQAKLAFFGKNKETLNETFRLCNLINAENAHPFLYKMDVLKHKGILDFYTKYLSLRSDFIQQCVQEKKYADYHFLKLGDLNQDIKQLIEKQQNAILNLPRGLFRQPVLNALKSAGTSRDLALRLESEPRANVAFIIKEYFSAVRKDSPQEFYEFNRSYDLLNKLYDTRRPRSRDSLPEIPFSQRELEQKASEIKQELEQKIEDHIRKNKVTKAADKERIKANYLNQYKHFTDDEKQIRLAKTCDMVLFMLADQLYTKGDFLFDQDEKVKDLSLGEKYKLKVISPNADRSILSQEVSVALPLYYGPQTRSRKEIIRKHIKVKNIGDFRAFLKDRRIYGLLPFVTAEHIEYEAVKRELLEFERSRETVFRTIIDFESLVISQKRLVPNVDGYIEHKEILKQVNNLSEDQRILMSNLRNTFCHSQYPRYDHFKDKIDGSQFNELNQAGASEMSIIVQLKKLTIAYYEQAMAMVL